MMKINNDDKNMTNISNSPQVGNNDVIGQETLSTTSSFRNTLRRFYNNKLAVAGFVIFLIILIGSIGAPLFTKFDPVLDMDLRARLLKPGEAGHLLGTDDYGRDIFSRLLYGGRISLMTGLIVSFSSAIIGVIIGGISGFYGGKIDIILMRVVDIFLAFPFLILAITIMAVLGPSLANIIIALAFVSWPGFARLTRGQVLAVKNQEYVEAAVAAGFTKSRILLFHVLPNCMGPIIVQGTLSIGGAILAAASLNFLGLGVDAASAEWGVMLNQGKEYMTTAAHLTLYPGILISLTVLSMNWIGDGLRDALDPRMRD